MRIGEFDNLDRAGDAGAFAAHTDFVRALDAIVAAKAWTDACVLGASGPPRVLDVGCGTGEDLTRLSGAVGADDCVVGVDLAHAMLDETHARGAPGRTRRILLQADGAHLPFVDGSFSGARVDRVLLHVASPGLVIAEMARVVRPGGRVVALEPDFETGVIGVPGEDSIQRRLKEAQMGSLVRSPTVGRSLVAHLTEAGLVDVDVKGWVSIITSYQFAIEALGIERVVAEATGTHVSATEADRWLAALRRAAEAGTFFSALTFFAACGTKVG